LLDNSLNDDISDFIDIINIIIFYHPKMDKENYFNVKIDNSSEVYEDYEDSQTSFVMTVTVAIFDPEKKIFFIY